MKTTKTLASQLETLQSGNCWIGYNAREILDGIDETLAGFAAYEGGNSIWQLVNHISYWREMVVNRLINQRIEADEATGMDNPAIASVEAWQQTLVRFRQSYERLLNTIINFPEEMLDTRIGAHSNYGEIAGCLVHDAFHLGQIVLLKKMAEKENQFAGKR